MNDDNSNPGLIYPCSSQVTIFDFNAPLTDLEHSMMIDWGSRDVTLGDLEAICCQFIEMFWNLFENSKIKMTNDELLAELQHAFIPLMQKLKKRYGMDKR